MFFDYSSWYTGPPNANTVRIQQTFGLRCGGIPPFDTTYPIALQGYIDQGEFNENINRINDGLAIANLYYRVAYGLGALVILIFIVLAIVVFVSRFFWQLWIAALLFLVFCQFFPMFVCCAGRAKALRSIQHIVNDINQRYRERSIQWRLSWMRVGFGRYARNYYFVDIELPRTIVVVAYPPPAVPFGMEQYPQGQYPPQYSPQYPNGAPPPYTQ